jgi:hypothetical protein
MILEKNIPLPSIDRSNVGRPRKYDYSFLDEIERGDSFIVDNMSKKEFACYRVSLITHIKRQKLPYTVVTRTITDTKYRVWIL